jgi:hypothetical protein
MAGFVGVVSLGGDGRAFDVVHPGARHCARRHGSSQSSAKANRSIGGAGDGDSRWGGGALRRRLVGVPDTGPGKKGPQR